MYVCVCMYVFVHDIWYTCVYFKEKQLHIYMQLHARPSPWNSSPSLEVLNSKVGWHSDWSQITSHVIWPIQNSITKVTALPFRSGGPPAYALHVGTSHSFVAQSQQNARWVFSTRTFVKSQVAPPIVKEKLTEWIKEFINDMFNQLQPETRNEELRCLTLFWHFAAVHCFCSANIQPDPAQTNCSAIYPSNNSRCCSAKAFSSCAIDICLNTSGLGKPKKKHVWIHQFHWSIWPQLNIHLFKHMKSRLWADAELAAAGGTEPPLPQHFAGPASQKSAWSCR